MPVAAADHAGQVPAGAAQLAGRVPVEVGPREAREPVVVEGLHRRAAQRIGLGDRPRAELRVDVVKVDDLRAMSGDRLADEPSADAVVAVVQDDVGLGPEREATNVRTGQVERRDVEPGTAQDADLRLEHGVLAAREAVADVADQDAHRRHRGGRKRTERS